MTYMSYFIFVTVSFYEKWDLFCKQYKMERIHMNHLEKSPLFCSTQPKLSVFIYVFHFHSKVEVHLGSKNLVVSLSMTTFIQDWLFSKFYELILEDEIFIILIPITVSLLAVSIPADRNRVVSCIFDML